MAKIVVDTNALSGYFRGDSEITKKLESFEELVIPYVVVAELLAGYEYGDSKLKNAPILQAFIETSGVEVLYADTGVLDIYAELFAFLKKVGTPIPINDVWIAAITLRAGLPLYTLDSDFKRLPQLRLA